MHIPDLFISIFRKGSRTYFYSSLFFPPDVRRDVSILYAFVRTADDYVDKMPQDTEGFHAFVRDYNAAVKGKPSDNTIIQSFVELEKRKEFDPSWTRAFLDAMRSDITQKNYKTIDDTIKYMYGSAEVIGCMMARILALPTSSYACAKLLGRAMQYVNFIRDIAEDQTLGRTYLPLAEIKKAGLASLDAEEIRSKKEAFHSLIQSEIKRYISWQKEAEKGYVYIPRRYLIPIKTAANMYLWTAQEIEKHPQLVFTKKVKPSLFRILTTVLKNALSL
jgi:phytoene synthase